MNRCRRCTTLTDGVCFVPIKASNVVCRKEHMLCGPCRLQSRPQTGAPGALGHCGFCREDVFGYFLIQRNRISDSRYYEFTNQTKPIGTTDPSVNLRTIPCAVCPAVSNANLLNAIGVTCHPEHRFCFPCIRKWCRTILMEDPSKDLTCPLCRFDFCRIVVDDHRSPYDVNYVHAPERKVTFVDHWGVPVSCYGDA